jgi:hypothetical protein
MNDMRPAEELQPVALRELSLLTEILRQTTNKLDLMLQQQHLSQTAIAVVQSWIAQHEQIHSRLEQARAIEQKQWQEAEDSIVQLATQFAEARGGFKGGWLVFILLSGFIGAVSGIGVTIALHVLKQ